MKYIICYVSNVLWLCYIKKYFMMNFKSNVNGVQKTLTHQHTFRVRALGDEDG